MSHLAVAKTYKLFIGGAFPRSESGRTYQAHDHKDNFMANAALASRKDLRDAVVAARKGYAAWSKATAYNRGQVIYRMAEMLEGRRTEFVELIMTSTGASTRNADLRGRCCDRSSGALRRLDRQARRSARERQPGIEPLLLLLRSRTDRRGWDPRATRLAVARPRRGARARDHRRQCLRRDRCRAGSVRCDHLRRGRRDVGCAARRDQHSDRPDCRAGSAISRRTRMSNALDLTGADAELRESLEQAAAETVKRVYAPRGVPDFAAAPGTARLRAFLEIKTVWHPTGALALSGGTSY